MDIAPTAEQEELRAVVRDFLTDRSPETEVRRLMAEDAGSDPKVWAQLAEQLGVAGLAVPEEHGGAGYGWQELMVVLEEAGRALLCAPLLSTAVLAVGALRECDAQVQADLLPALAAGSRTATVALDGTAHADGDRLTGRLDIVLDGHTAGLLLVPASGALYAVDGDAAGLTRTLLPSLDETRKLARVELDATPGRLVAADAAPVLARVRDLAATALAAEQVGSAGRLVEMAVGYAKDREQFGRPIGSFQAVKHTCADMFVQLESARAAAWHASWAASHAPEELPAAASLAKAFCCDAGFFVAAQNIQVHGGIGFTWEHPAHLYFKRAKSSQLLFGTATEHRERLVTLIGL